MSIRSMAVLIVALVVAHAWGRDIPPVVSTNWLAQNLDNPKLVVVDIRNVEQYNKGHVPGAFSAPFREWVASSNELSMELPSDHTIRVLLGRLGIQKDSIIVVLNSNDTDYARADAMRVAWTCTVAGLKNTSVLDGGFNKWIKEGRAVSTQISQAKSAIYAGELDRSSVALKSQVLRKIGKSIIVDTRVPEDYFGITSEHGHIKGAVNLPAPWIFKGNGAFRDPKQLQAIAEGVVGKNKSKEVILYCQVGIYASAWAFLLTQMLGYQNVKLYDGSLEEWTRDPQAPLTAYTWR